MRYWNRGGQKEPPGQRVPYYLVPIENQGYSFLVISAVLAEIGLEICELESEVVLESVDINAAAGPAEPLLYVSCDLFGKAIYFATWWK